MSLSADRHRRWVAQRTYLSSYDRMLVGLLKRYLGSRLLEVGCGFGTMTRHLLDRELVVAIDSDPVSLRITEQELGPRHNLITLPFDITRPPRSLLSLRLDSALCANVLEHVKEDQEALVQVAAALPPGGRLVVLVPAHQQLFSSLDRGAGHLRRYSLDNLDSLFDSAGFDLLTSYYVNPLGILGWLLNGKLLGLSSLPNWELRLFNCLAVPLTWGERHLPRVTGLSILAVGDRR